MGSATKTPTILSRATYKKTLDDQLTELGYEVLFMDQAKARLGGMLADIELIGIPHRVVIGDRGLDDGKIEYRHRRETENQYIATDDIVRFLSENALVKG